MSFLLVATGGAAGSVLRYLVSLVFMGMGWPWGTLVVNILGSFAMGVLAGIELSPQQRLFWMTGLLGGFTTFSAFSLETATLWERAHWEGVAYVALSLALGLAAFATGMWLARG
ncbi:fluoride efflux transporter CrcB [Roseococcus sp. SYP-B2431]|uniref:fluoride efflux transporter CrcB n=1 Tax=Roseococcus sp. SYP-B2431 TaxID=2496640 RepID=UPI0010393DC2|nr:fluoride efflux transporter CrcB [Roseococcus sp. SYP-B2431]TCH98041.1 fluoride efflux transporter CrcB [Roseococcus sp. SYP-B2431]